MKEDFITNSLDELINKIKVIINNKRNVFYNNQRKFVIKPSKLEKLGEIFENFGLDMLDLFLNDEIRRTRESNEKQAYKIIREEILPLLKNNKIINQQKDIGRYLIKSLDNIL
jgi:hypothetical protein